MPAIPNQRPATPAPTEAPTSSVFRIRLIDGRNGLPIDHAHLQLWYDETGNPAFDLTTNVQGVALMPAPVGTPVRVLVSPQDRIDCRKMQKDQNAQPEGYNLAAIAAAGTAAANHCGPIAAKPKLGELILFVRPLRWYEGINR